MQAATVLIYLVLYNLILCNELFRIWICHSLHSELAVHSVPGPLIYLPPLPPLSCLSHVLQVPVRGELAVYSVPGPLIYLSPPPL